MVLRAKVEALRSKARLVAAAGKRAGVYGLHLLLVTAGAARASGRRGLGAVMRALGTLRSALLRSRAALVRGLARARGGARNVRSRVHLRAGRLVIGALVVAGAAAVVFVATTWLPASTVAKPRVAEPIAVSAPIGSPWQMQVQGDCRACHEENGQIVQAEVPAIPHPVAGWPQCAACHADQGLVVTAPGHTGISAAECLGCHQAAQQPTVDFHRQPESPAPSISHAVEAGTACRGCHSEGQVGALPVSHDGLTDRSCTICHEPLSDQKAAGRVQK